jgi:hypothetical protein
MLVEMLAVMALLPTGVKFSFRLNSVRELKPTQAYENNSSSQ